MDWQYLSLINLEMILLCNTCYMEGGRTWVDGLHPSNDEDVESLSVRRHVEVPICDRWCQTRELQVQPSIAHVHVSSNCILQLE